MKILVVDDEALINQYVVQCIRDTDSNVQIVGTATSGEKALRILRETPVDLAFVDITMPKMDGLELLRTIKTEYPSTMVVMLTCHDEFEYARQAIQNKADNYILKSELTPEYMKKVLEELRSSRKRSGLARQTGLLKQNDYLKKLMSDSGGIYVITEENLRKNNIFLRSDGFIALCFQNISGNLEAVLAATEADYENPVVYAYNDDLTVLLLNIRRTGQQWDTFDALYTELDRYFQNVRKKMTGHLGHSRMFFRMARLGEAITEALEAHNDAFYLEKGSSEVPYAERTAHLQKLMTQTAIRIEEGNWEAARSALLEALEYAKRQHADSVTLKRTIQQVCAVLKAHCPAELDTCERRLSQAEDFPALEAGGALLVEAMERQSGAYSAAISGALAFMEQHYAEDLTLNMVADHVFLNREYLSRRFKQEVGMTFSEYLTAHRLKRAKELLETTGLRISEVASQVGIPNVSYFSTIVRKEFGCSPSDLRPKKPKDFS